MSVLAAPSRLLALKDLLRGRVACLHLLVTVLGRMAAVEDEVVEVTRSADAVHLLVLVRC